METPWRIELLGWLRAEQGGRVVTRFTTRKSAALLACLALWPRRAHSREELIDRLWPDADIDAGRQNLRQALASLRRQFEPPGTPAGAVLIADRTQIRLNPAAVSTDVADFEAALRAGRTADALALYKGELLPGFYEDWIEDERERLQACFDEAERREREKPTQSSAPDAAQAPPPPAMNAPSVRLPMQFTTFFGREEELIQVGGLLAAHRLVTLTGPGGAGKTRLAIEAARRQAGVRTVVFVGLADVADGARVAEAVAEALHQGRDDARPALDRIAEALGADPALLVLDNVEHVAAHAGPLAQALLARVPALRLLASSRRRLHVAGEREFAVPALPLPGGGGTPEQVLANVGVQIFVDRAQAVRPDFQVTARNASDIAALGSRLEGSPLALELAAARVSALSPAQMLEKLDHRFELLATRRTDKDARHRSLWATIAWSVDLLPAGLRRFWAQLSVFRGGFTADAACAVTGEEAALEALTQLRERSLASVGDAGGEMRFRLLESLREFAVEQMDEAERRDTRRRHGAFFLGLAEASVGALRGPEQGAWLDRLEAEHDNFRAALAGSIRDGDADGGMRLAAALWGFWERRGYPAECRLWLERALAIPAPPGTPARAKALDRLGATLNAQGDVAEAVRVHGEALALYRTLGDDRGVALMRNRQGHTAYQCGRYGEARAAFSEALALERDLGNGFNVGSALMALGIVAQRQGAYAEAENWCAEGLAQFRQLNAPGPIGDALLNLASIRSEQGDLAGAVPLLEQARAVHESVGDRWSRAYATLGLAIVARHQGRWEDAARLGQEALDVCREVGDEAECGAALLHLGVVALCCGDCLRAEAHLHEALRLFRRLGQTPSLPRCLRECGALALAQGRPERAAQLLGAAESLCGQIGTPLSPVDQPRYNGTLAAVREALGGEAFRRLWAAGAALSTDAAVAEALEEADGLPGE